MTVGKKHSNLHELARQEHRKIRSPWWQRLLILPVLFPANEPSRTEAPDRINSMLLIRSLTACPAVHPRRLKTATINCAVRILEIGVYLGQETHLTGSAAVQSRAAGRQ